MSTSPTPASPDPRLDAARAAWLAGDRTAWTHYTDALARLGSRSETLAPALTRHAPRRLLRDRSARA